MSTQASANMRVRISADLADIKQGLAVLRGELARTQREAGRPLPGNNPIRQLGVSAGQTAAAMRQLPAQFTDIATSIQGGMPIFTVLLQQGGQIRDAFGGTRAALAGVGTAITSMINPVTVAAAAIGGMALAWKQAADAQFEFDKALITTGDASGKTTEELQDLVGTLDTLDGVTRGAAAEAVLEVAKSGRFAGEQFDQVAEAAARMEGATGQAIDTTIDKFKDLAKDPVDALLKLNETEHFLTQTQLDRVTALEEEGKEQEAVAEAVRIYSDHLDDVTRQANDAMPAMSRWWRDITDEISAAYGEVQKYITLLDRAVKMDFGGSSSSPGLVSSFIHASNPVTRMREFNQWAERRLDQADFQRNGATVEWQGLYANNPNGDLPAVDLREERKELESLTESLDKAARKKAEINRETKNEEQKATEALSRTYESMSEQLARQLVLFGDVSSAARLNYEIQMGGLKGITEEQALQLRQQAWLLDMMGYMDEAEDVQRKNEEDAIKGLEKRTDAMTVFADEAARNIQGFLGDGLYQILDGRFSDIGDSFADMLKRMGAELLGSQILEWLSGTSVFSLFGSSDEYTGFAAGGYTGPGAVDTPAGIVHRGEVVWSQRDVARAGGVGIVEAMRLGWRGYASGGVVGGMAGFGPGKVEVNIENQTGTQMEARATGVRFDAGRLIVDVVAKAIGTGQLDTAAGQAWGLRRPGVPRG